MEAKLASVSPADARMGERLHKCAMLACSVLSLVFLPACAALQDIENPEDVAGGQSYQAQYRSDRSTEAKTWKASSSSMNARRCVSEKGASAHVSPKILPDIEILSPGDLLQVSISDDDLISGQYEVSQDGRLKLLHVPAVSAKGRTVDAVEDAVRRKLMAEGLYASVPRVSIRVMDFAPARVFVAGAVFEPGAVTVGSVDASDADRLRQQTSGGRAGSRRLSRALQMGGGVRPDADLSRVQVKRGSRTMVLDIRPAITGRAYSDLILLEGDQIEVPSRGCFQEELMAPSPISPPGVKVFMSNLSVPADSNSDAAIGKDTAELRYGTRFLQAVFGMNCIGGAKLTNSDRTAVLFSRNPMTGESVVIERRLEDLLRRRDRDEYDPYLMPGDALACYDSSFTNITDVARGLGIGIGAAVAASAL